MYFSKSSGLSPCLKIGGFNGAWDVNNDGKVDIIDLVIVARAFGSTSGDSNWDARADLNKDDSVDIMDLVIVARNFGKGA